MRYALSTTMSLLGRSRFFITYVIARCSFTQLALYLQEAQPLDYSWDLRDATYYRPACPQIEDLIQQDIPGFEYTNEDCLHINVFQPNVS